MYKIHSSYLKITAMPKYQTIKILEIYKNSGAESRFQMYCIITKFEKDTTSIFFQSDIYYYNKSFYLGLKPILYDIVLISYIYDYHH